MKFQLQDIIQIIIVDIKSVFTQPFDMNLRILGLYKSLFGYLDYSVLLGLSKILHE